MSCWEPRKYVENCQTFRMEKVCDMGIAVYVFLVTTHGLNDAAEKK